MLRAHKGEIPFLYCLAPFIAGAAANQYAANPQLLGPVVIAFTIACVVFITLNLTYNAAKAHQYSWLGGVMMHVILLSAGWLCSYEHNDLNNADHFSKLKADYLVVRVNTEPTQKGIYTRFVAQAQNTYSRGKQQSATGKLLITLIADSNAHFMNYGDLLLIPANYKITDPPFNPAEFNYKQYLARQNIYHQSFISLSELKLLKSDAGDGLITYAIIARQHFVASIKRYLESKEAEAIASTLLLGYKADLSEDTLQAYSKTGTIHVLSVSGAHVAVFFWLISSILKPFRHYRYGKLLNALLSLVLIWGYALLTGFSPAVCRAALMLSMIILSRTSGRPVHTLNVLAVSAFVLLLYNPFLLTDVGFQLSYLAVFGLIVIQPIIHEQFEFKHPLLRKLWYLCSASLAAQLITFPLSALYFHQFPVYFLISNLLILLPAEGIVIIGLFFLAFTCIPAMTAVTKGLAFILEHLILLMNKLLNVIEHWPYASINRIWLNGWQHFLLYGIILSLVYFLVYKQARQLKITLVAFLLLCTSLSWKAVYPINNYRIIFFNVKKHSAILFQKDNHAVVVTDLQTIDRTYKYSIEPCLDSLGVDSLTICKADQNIQLPHFKKRFGLIQFLDKTVMLFNPSVQKVVLPEKLTVDYLFFTHNPHTNIRRIRQNFNFQHIIADANNSGQQLNKLKTEADSLHLKINFLKRNKSFIVASKY